MLLSNALSMLRQQPLVFLKNNLLSITSAAESGVTPYYFGYYNGFPVGVNEAYKLSCYMFDVDMNIIPDDFMFRKMLLAHCIVMNANANPLNILNIPGYTLDSTGPDIMVTGQLSGCVIAIRQLAGGRMVVSHIQPGGGRPDGVALRATVQGGQFNGGRAVTHVFGLGDYEPRAYLVGIRTAGVWHLYAQIIETAKGPITRAVMIL